MILRPNPRLLFKPARAAAAAASTTASHRSIRLLHHRIPQRPIPPPTPFIPDVSSFLTVIGRKLSQHAAKIPSWEALFSLTSQQLRELGVEPPRSRRYLLHWREKFRNGEYGIGGDLHHVHDGVAEVRIVEAPLAKSGAHEGKGARGPRLATATQAPGTKKMVVNVPQDATVTQGMLKAVKPVQGLKVQGAHTIVGPYVQPVKGTNGMVARLAVTEGLWEERRGHKVDGGERRKAEVRAKRRASANKK